MAKRQKSNKKTFLNDAEKIMRQYADQNEDIIIWRGEYLHGGDMFEKETIIAGIDDNNNPKEAPTIPIMKVWIDFCAQIEFSTEEDSDIFQWCPFGNNPLKEVREQTKRLPQLFE